MFNHDTRHEGSQVLKGVKYIMRTEVMFKVIRGTENSKKIFMRYHIFSV